MFRVTCAGLMGLIAFQLIAQTQVDLKTQSKSVDFQGATFTRPLKTSAVLPATCTVNELLVLTSAPPGSNIYLCVTANNWVSEGGSAASVTVQNGGSSIGARGTANFVPALGISNVITDLGSKINIQQGVDTAVVPSHAVSQAGQSLLCQSLSGSGSAYTCALNPTLTGYTAGMVLHWQVDVGATGGGTTLNVDTLGPVAVKESDGATDPTPSEVAATRMYLVWFDGTVFRLLAGGGSAGAGGSTPAGSPNKVVATDPSGTATDVAVVRALVPADLPSGARTHGFQVTFGGGDLAPGSVIYATLPFACNATGYAISADPSGTATIMLAKVADGTALPASANSISTSGFSLSSGARIHSTVLTDLSTTTWAAWDTTAVTLAAVSGTPTHVNFTLECDQ